MVGSGLIGLVVLRVEDYGPIGDLHCFRGVVVGVRIGYLAEIEGDHLAICGDGRVGRCCGYGGQSCADRTGKCEPGAGRDREDIDKSQAAVQSVAQDGPVCNRVTPPHLPFRHGEGDCVGYQFADCSLIQPSIAWFSDFRAYKGFRDGRHGDGDNGVILGWIRWVDPVGTCCTNVTRLAGKIGDGSSISMFRSGLSHIGIYCGLVIHRQVVGDDKEIVAHGCVSLCAETITIQYAVCGIKVDKQLSATQGGRVSGSGQFGARSAPDLQVHRINRGRSQKSRARQGVTHLKAIGRTGPGVGHGDRKGDQIRSVDRRYSRIHGVGDKLCGRNHRIPITVAIAETQRIATSRGVDREIGQIFR